MVSRWQQERKAIVYRGTPDGATWTPILEASYVDVALGGPGQRFLLATAAQGDQKRHLVCIDLTTGARRTGADVPGRLIAISPDGTRASLHDSETVRVVDLDTLAPLPATRQAPAGPYDLGWLAPHTLVASGIGDAGGQRQVLYP